MGAPVTLTSGGNQANPAGAEIGTAANPLVTSASNGSGGTATALPPGRAAAASSVPTVLSNEDFARLGSIAFGGGTPTVTSVTSVAATTSLKAANAARTGITIANDSTSILYVLMGTGTASATNYSFALPAKGTVPSDRTISGYTGAIQGFWVSANGFAMVTEVA